MLLKKEIEHVTMMLECDLKLSNRAFLFANSSKTTCTSAHDKTSQSGQCYIQKMWLGGAN